MQGRLHGAVVLDFRRATAQPANESLSSIVIERDPANHVLLPGMNHAETSPARSSLYPEIVPTKISFREITSQADLMSLMCCLLLIPTRHSRSARNSNFFALTRDSRNDV